MNKIKIYDVDAYMRKKHKMACHSFRKVAIFQGPSGVVVAEEEAIRDRLKSVDDAFTFSLTPIPAPGRMFLTSTHAADIPVSFLLEKVPCQEMDFYAFFNRRNYNPRCEANFNGLCSDLRAIGYEIPKEPLNTKIQQAASKTAPQHTSGRSAPLPERC